MEVNLDLGRDIPVLDWTPRLAARAARMKDSAIRELLKRLEQPDVISFAGGMPAPEFFPLPVPRTWVRSRRGMPTRRAIRR